MKQRWRCKDCGWEYESPLPIIAMSCGKSHKPFGKRVMELIEGSPVRVKPVSTVPRGRKGVTHG